jgi:nucleotide-binding universal stress UspA family protein
LYRRIFVAVDDSPCAWLAFDEALRIAAAADAFVTVATVVQHVAPMEDLDFDSGGMPPFDSSSLLVAEQTLTKAQHWLVSRQVKGMTLKIDSLTDTVAEAITRSASQSRAELLVMGTHGRRGFERILSGSVAEAVIRQSAIPVLLIRARNTQRNDA